MKTNKIYADKVNELLAKQNAVESSEESSEETETPRVTEFLDDEYEIPHAQSTEFRKRNIKLLSEQSAKYKGKVTSRKELEQESEDYEDSDSDMEESPEASDNDDMDDLKAFGNKLKQMSTGDKLSKEENYDIDSGNDNEIEEADTEESDEADSEDGDEEEEDDDDDFDQSDLEDEDMDGTDQQIVSESNRQTEIQKGVCVQNQLRIWEKLLEMRIQSQKILTKANQLPAPSEFQEISNDDATKIETVNNVSTLLGKLLDLQQALSHQYPEIRKEVKSTHKRMSNSVSNDEPPSKRFGAHLKQHFTEFRNYRNNVLLKWDDRTRVMTPGANKRKSIQEEFDVLKKIDHALNNRQSLIQRSQTLKSNNNQEEQVKEESAAVIGHIYDDSDFYHQQLRELIEYKANTTSNMAEVTKQYVELQKLRQKMKKKVDTRASKGRKMRYVVHNKLVNFMAPEDTSKWTEESKDELYKSLFVT